MMFVAAQVIAVFNWSNVGIMLAVRAEALLVSLALNVFGALFILILLATFFFLFILPRSRSTLFPYTTLFRSRPCVATRNSAGLDVRRDCRGCAGCPRWRLQPTRRSEEHTSELQSQSKIVCRLLLEKKK